jgi:flavin reductase (DIM6/NTAB) family NADH-FMN oxidoreductase RutF
MEHSWQEVLDRFCYGIYLISLTIDAKDNGMIASWVSQCSHEPPLVLVAIRKNRLSHAQITQTGSFCINVLPRESLPLLGRFKIPDWQNKFDGLACRRSLQGTPVLKQAIGYLDCTVETTVETGDHTLFIGRIVAGEFLNELQPLVTSDYGGNYRGDR